MATGGANADNRVEPAYDENPGEDGPLGLLDLPVINPESDRPLGLGGFRAAQPCRRGRHRTVSALSSGNSMRFDH